MADQFEEAEEFVKVKRDRFKRYLLPDPKGDPNKDVPWTRVTTLARTLTDEYQLNQWRIREVVYGIGQRPDLAALASASHHDDKDQLQEIGERAQEVAGASAGASMGRALHTFSQRQDGGRPSAPPQYLPYLNAYQAALHAAGYAIEARLIERIVLEPNEVRCAGQFDRILMPRITMNTPAVGERGVIGDLKTAKLESIQYGWLEIAIQLATYAHSTLMWDHDGQRWHAMPPVDLEHAIVMHLPQDLPPDQARCDIYRIDIVKGWEYALLAAKVRAARSAQKSLTRLLTGAVTTVAEKVDEVPAPAVEEVDESGQEYIPALESTPLDRVRTAADRRALSALWQEGTAAGWWTPELTAAGRARLAEL